jgi:predicted ferric reductase
LVLVTAGVAAGFDSRTVWYIIRGSGTIAYGMLAAAVLLGLLITNRALPSGRPRVDLYEVHILIALLALAFTVVHGVALLLDSYIGFTRSQMIVPFTSDFRPVAVALGIFAFYLSLMVYVSFWARKYIGYRAWRALHFSSFGAFILAALHGLLSGADSGTWWMTGVYAISIAAVVALTFRRVMAASGARPRQLAAARPMAWQ